MDNFSHSVVGLALGEFVHRSLPPEPGIDSHRARRRLLLFSGWAASNFPDLDLFLTPLLPAPLGYLMHHRGHTHTLLYAAGQALLLWAMLWLLWPAARTLLRQSASARTGLLVAVSAGLALHLLMDYLNPYGIHPFHPFDSRWLYGDMVFILEPMFWITFGVPMAMMVQRLAPRLLFLAALAAAPLYFAARGFLSWGSVAMLALVGIVLATLQLRSGTHGRRALVAALGVMLCFVGVQAVASRQARMVVAKTLQEKEPANRLLDTSMSSFPTNPLCWAFVSVESNEGKGTYTLRRGILSLAPNGMPVENCPASLAGSAFEKGATPAIAFQLEQQGRLTTLRELKAANCYFEAWLRFARAPLLGANAATDIRFGSDPRENFTTIDLAVLRERECVGFIPAWQFPRSDLLALPTK